MIRAGGGAASAYPCDVSDDAQVAGAVGAAHDDLGRISGVVTAAGIFHGPDLRPAHEVSVEDFMTVLRVQPGRDVRGDQARRSRISWKAAARS